MCAASHLRSHTGFGTQEGLTHAFQEWVPGGSLPGFRCGATVERRPPAPTAAGADADGQPAVLLLLLIHGNLQDEYWQVCRGVEEEEGAKRHGEWSAVCPDERTSVNLWWD